MKDKTNETDSLFIKVHFGDWVAPLFLFWCAFLALVILLKTDSKESLVHLKGQVTNVRAVNLPAGYGQKNGPKPKTYSFEFTVREHPQTFFIETLGEVDALMLMRVEKQGNEFRFAVEKDKYDDPNEAMLTIRGLQTDKNTYLKDDQTAFNMSGNRKIAAFFLVSFLIYGLSLRSKAQKIKKAFVEKPPQEAFYHPYLYFFVQEPIQSILMASVLFYFSLLVILTSEALRVNLVLTGLCFLYLYFQYKKKWSLLPIWNEILENEKKYQESKKQKVTTTAPKHVQAVEMILKSGRNINAVNSTGLTALHLSVQAGSVEAVDLLLRHGADLTLVDSKARSPLMIAAETGSTPMFLKLLNAGADILFTNEKGQTVLNFAETSEHKSDALIELIKKEVQKAEIKKLEEQKAEQQKEPKNEN